MHDFKGKTVLVTGAGSGIGRASALAFAEAGASVVASDIDAVAGAETLRLLEAIEGDAVFLQADVADCPAVDRLIDTIVDLKGRLDCALNNAGVESRLTLLAQAEEADWDRCIAVNLKGVWACMRAELRQMVRQGGGVIVNTASLGGLIAVPQNADYCAAKHGVIGLTKTAAVEYATANIRINALCPGVTRTAMNARLTRHDPDLTDKILPPMGRMAEAGEIAQVALFLCSSAASYVTGQAIAVDGGATAI